MTLQDYLLIALLVAFCLLVLALALVGMVAGG